MGAERRPGRGGEDGREGSRLIQESMGGREPDAAGREGGRQGRREKRGDHIVDNMLTLQPQQQDNKRGPLQCYIMAIPSEPGPIMVTVQWPNPNGCFDDAGVP